jgi:hypothetical protein
MLPVVVRGMTIIGCLTTDFPLRIQSTKKKTKSNVKRSGVWKNVWLNRFSSYENGMLLRLHRIAELVVVGLWLSSSS